MKFNLKRLREICENECAGAIVYDALEGFEKELREKKPRYLNYANIFEYYKALENFIKEILGDWILGE